MYSLLRFSRLLFELLESESLLDDALALLALSEVSDLRDLLESSPLPSSSASSLRAISQSANGSSSSFVAVSPTSGGVAFSDSSVLALEGVPPEAKSRIISTISAFLAREAGFPPKAVAIVISSSRPLASNESLCNSVESILKHLCVLCVEC